MTKKVEIKGERPESSVDDAEPFLRRALGWISQVWRRSSRGPSATFARLRPRERVLALVVLSTALVFFGIRSQVLPQIEELNRLRRLLGSQSEEYSRLRAYVGFRRASGERFTEVAETLEQKKSDEATMSDFVRAIEAKARNPQMTLVNMKPEPIRVVLGHKIYAVRVSLRGSLRDFVRFIFELFLSWNS